MVSLRSHLQESTRAVNRPFGTRVKVLFISHDQPKKIITHRYSFCSLSISFIAGKNEENRFK